MTHDSAAAIATLLNVMARLRDPETGCPWDQAQDFASIAPFTVEEAYEVASEIGSGPNPLRLRDELGDLLLQVVYHARLAEERGWFSFTAVATGISDKMVRRHPHVFTQIKSADTGSQSDSWERLKLQERVGRAETGTLSGIAPGLPALTHAVKLTQRAAGVGFDWPDANTILDKLAEESAELRAELTQADRERLADEVGDLLFVLANLARKLNLNPEACLRAACSKFMSRFQDVEAQLAEVGRSPAEATFEEMEAAWQKAKRRGP